MPITEKQLDANRRNAQRSTGPRTDHGKRTASINALRHGLTGTVTLMTPEDRAAHDAFTTEYIAALKAEGPIERELAETIADHAWRLKRARSLDQNIYALAHPALNGDNEAPMHENPEVVTAASEARAFLTDCKQFQLLTLYEQRIQRSMEKAVARLEELRAERKAAHEAAFLEAQRLARLNYIEGSSYEPAADFPAENGFVFSIGKINEAIRRADRLTRVKYYEKRFWDTTSSYRPPSSPIVEQPEPPVEEPADAIEESLAA